MYWDLRSKLEMYKNNPQPKKPALPESTGLDVHDLLQGTSCSNADGTFFMIENRFPLSYLHGGYSLGRALEIDLFPLMKLCCGPEEAAELRDFIFLDTETTGLSGGAGTVAFLVGAGFFEDSCFILRQYLMRDYDEEAALLSALNELLSSRSGLITFNGKAFDWNLLQTRYTANRLRLKLREPIHLDLLFPSRRIWKLKLESCRLSSLEENILGECRTDDIPGAMIPGIYFRYLEDRNAVLLKKVIRHNELDILSLVSLLLKIHSLLTDPLSESSDARELLGVGSLFERGGEYAGMLDCYHACTDSDTFGVKETAFKRLAGIHKKNGDHGKAAEYLESLLSTSPSPGIPVMIELAKYYEHKEKNIPKALEITENAMELSFRLGIKNSLHYGPLKARLERLKRKAAKL